MKNFFLFLLLLIGSISFGQVQFGPQNDLSVTGQSAQTATVNNILTAASGSAATDLKGYRSFSVQIISTGTGGTFIFEGSNDNTNFQTVPCYSQLIVTGTPIVAAVTATSSNLIYVGPINFRYFRVRIATTITGGSIQAVSRFSQSPFTPAFTQVTQNSSGNLNVNVGAVAAGQTAHSSASTGAPVRAGGRVLATTAATQDATLVAGDAADVGITTGGQVSIKPYGTSENDWVYAAAASGIASTTTAVTFKAASGTANIRNYITAIQIYADGGGTATELAVRDGAAGTVIWRLKIPTGGFPTPVSFTFSTPLKGTANTLLEVITLTSSAGAVYFNAQGYTGF